MRAPPPPRLHPIALQTSPQVNHIFKQNACLHDRVVVVVDEEILDAVVAHETAYLVKGHRERAVPRTHLQRVIGTLCVSRDELDERTTKATALVGWIDGKVLDLEHAVPFIGYHADPNRLPRYIEGKHGTVPQIAVYHILLLVGKQKQLKVVALGALRDASNVHGTIVPTRLEHRPAFLIATHRRKNVRLVLLLSASFASPIRVMEASMVDYLIVGAALALAVFILVRQAMRIGRGGGCGCEGGGARPVRQRRRRVHHIDAKRYPYALELQVSGMHCENCARRIEDALQSLDVIAEAKLPGTVIVRSKHPVDKEACSRAVREAGYEVVEAQI